MWESSEAGRRASSIMGGGLLSDVDIGHRSRSAAIRGTVVAEVPGIGRPRRKRLSK